MSNTFRRRAYAYLTRRGRGGLELAVFRYPDFETMTLGYQVPGGTIEPSETPEAGALREAFEESGIAEVAEVRFLANDVWYSEQDGITRRRYFYQLSINQFLPDAWSHTVSDGKFDKGMVFRYRWLSVTEAGELLGHMGDCLHLL